MATTTQTGLAAPDITIPPFDAAQYYRDTKEYIGKLPKTYETHFGDRVRFFVEKNLEPNESHPNFDFCSEVYDITPEAEAYREEARRIGSRVVAVGIFMLPHSEQDAKRQPLMQAVVRFAFKTALIDTLGIAANNGDPNYRRMAQLSPPHLQYFSEELIGHFIRSMPNVRPIAEKPAEEVQLTEQEHPELTESDSIEIAA